MISLLEAGMLICFGAAWPFSIYKSYTSKSNKGKSLNFLIILLVGYIFGIAHKLTANPDAVTMLYVLNAIMVGTDIALYLKNEKKRD